MICVNRPILQLLERLRARYAGIGIWGHSCLGWGDGPPGVRGGMMFAAAKTFGRAPSIPA